MSFLCATEYSWTFEGNRFLLLPLIRKEHSYFPISVCNESTVVATEVFFLWWSDIAVNKHLSVKYPRTTRELFYQRLSVLFCCCFVFQEKSMKCYVVVLKSSHGWWRHTTDTPSLLFLFAIGGGIFEIRNSM